MTNTTTARYAAACLLICSSWLQQAKAQFTPKANKQVLQLVNNDLDFAVKQYKHMAQHVPEKLLPRTTNSDGGLMTSNTGWWTSGFYPGTLWYLYEYAHDTAVQAEATKRMLLLTKEQYNKGTHDLGFMMYCSFGNAYRLQPSDAYKKILITSSNSLSTRFKPTVGCIKSWDNKEWQFPVIIDNMMNLELLCWASKATGDSSYLHIAKTHANTTMAHHFRPDYSSYHVVNYDTTTGKVISRITAQGYADESAWSRGQAWGLYGYTVMYRETKDPAYLQQAQHIAAYILNNPAMPKDLVPYWDYNIPDTANAKRDASAAAITASALLELSTYADKKEGTKYWTAAESIIRSLSSAAYLAKEGENNNFLLMHSTGFFKANSEVDVPLTYADYYFVEALMRYKKLTGK
ncbi:AGE family epimerase/isomerase [Deminuibacter soli]|nr:glycoside hydrolase family 88 protein [Deminuibacter soli]